MPKLQAIKKWEKFGKLTALWESERRPVWKTIQRFDKMKCECWNIVRKRRSDLRSWNTRSCWCITLSRNWESGTRFFNIYRCIVKRCTNPKHSSFSLYGWRWIKCEWESYEDFKRDMYDSYIEHCKKFWEKQTSIDRLDNSKNYNKENCRWATWKEQNNNQSRSVKYYWHWKELWLSQIYDLAKPVVSRTVYYTRVRQNWWDIDKALNTPSKWEKVL